jgi:hypothetical protein
VTEHPNVPVIIRSAFECSQPDLVILSLKLLGLIIRRGDFNFLVTNGLDDYVLHQCVSENVFKVKIEAMSVACLMFIAAGDAQKCKYLERQIAVPIEAGLLLSDDNVHRVASQALIELFQLGRSGGNGAVMDLARQIAADAELDDEVASFIFDASE